MAELKDFFQQSHDTVLNNIPLSKLKDNDSVPDLRRYQVKDLRNWVHAVAPGLPETLPAGIIQSPSQIGDGVVVASKIDWQSMPPMRLVSWTSNHNNAWAVPNGTEAWMDHTDTIYTPEIFPERPGYIRQYRFSWVFAHVNAPGETLFTTRLGYVVMDTIGSVVSPSNGFQANYPNSSNVATNVRFAQSNWQAASNLDAVTLPCRVSLYGVADWAGAVGAVYARSAALEGRYVKQ